MEERTPAVPPTRQMLRSGSGCAPKSVFELAGIWLEEIIFQDVADFEQQRCVDARTVKDLIDVGAVAIEFAREPNH